MATNEAEKIPVENVNHPEQVRRRDAGKYAATKRALLKALPATSPGLTLLEVHERVLAHLPETLFPEGARVRWWATTVRLDLEAKGMVVREKTKPLRWRKRAG